MDCLTEVAQNTWALVLSRHPCRDSRQDDPFGSTVPVRTNAAGDGQKSGNTQDFFARSNSRNSERTPPRNIRDNSIPRNNRSHPRRPRAMLAHPFEHLIKIGG